MSIFAKTVNRMIIALKRAEIPVWFIGLVFTSLCLVYRMQSDSKDSLVLVFHINFNETLSVVGLCLLFTALVLLKPKFRMDMVLLALALGMVMAVVPYGYAANTNNYWGNFLPLAISVVSYLICLQNKKDPAQALYGIFAVVCITLTIQVIITEYLHFHGLSLSNYNNVLVKYYMHVPIGASNTITSYLLPMLVFINAYKQDRTSFAVTAISVFGLLLCRSKNALSIAFLIIMMLAVVYIYLYIIRDHSISRRTKQNILLFLTASMSILMALVIKILEKIVMSLRFDYASPFANPVLKYFDMISSGRLVVFVSELTRFTKHAIFGNGFGYDVGYLRSHNWLIEVLVQRGIIGCVLYLFSLFMILKTGIQNRRDRFTRASLWLLGVIYVQGLFEISVFTTGIDFLIWSIGGLIIAQSRQARLNPLRTGY